MQKTVVSAWAGSRQAEAELSGFVGERLYATEDIRANGGEPHVMARLFRLMRATFHAWRKAQLASGASRAAGSVAYLLTQLATLAIGVTLFTRGQMTIGAVYLDNLGTLDDAGSAPEPVTLAVLAIGAVGIAVHRRPRPRASHGVQA